jgi:2-polyprenyl-3-methyl-5-hydroxy-6-metoxy-1,4-benzoquinol methylase
MFDPILYWTNPPDKQNKPSEYAKYIKRSDFLMSFLPNYVTKDESILELGCNCGRNLNALYLAGYYNLTGIDINATAIQYGSIAYPDLYSIAEFYTESIESWMSTNPSQYDCIFTMAVLEHIPKGSEWIFYNIAHKARNTIITIEDEQSISEKHHPRNYQQVFDALGWRQVFYKQADKSNELEGITARIFVRKVVI